MASADVRCPCGEFAKRQGIIHFAFPEPQKLRYNLQLKACSFPKRDTDRTDVIVVSSKIAKPSEHSTHIFVMLDTCQGQTILFIVDFAVPIGLRLNIFWLAIKSYRIYWVH